MVDSIIKKLPYTDPFLFVDNIETVTGNSIVGNYTFKRNESFYAGHFKNNPVTPGVILTECCAQIGLACLGIYLLRKVEANAQEMQIALSSSEMQYLLPVYPMETVTVTSTKIYFRFNKLKCSVKMCNAQGAVVCTGILSGMLKEKPHE